MKNSLRYDEKARRICHSGAILGEVDIVDWNGDLQTFKFANNSTAFPEINDVKPGEVVFESDLKESDPDAWQFVIECLLELAEGLPEVPEQPDNSKVPPELLEKQRDLQFQLASVNADIGICRLGGTIRGQNKSDGSDSVIGGIKVSFRTVSDLGMNDMKSVADKLKGDGIAVVASLNDKGKTQLVVASGRPESLDAKTIFNASGLKGGGRPDMAQGGGNAAIETAFANIRNFLAESTK